MVRGAAVLVNGLQRGLWLAGIAVVGIVATGRRTWIERNSLPWWGVCASLAFFAVASVAFTAR